ncbi:two pore domain potassium channel family protein [Noviherbaspirillum sp. CPCC 100848]|uniref:Two pore domain potassium channel family protein n=1 Tax=Noviherbaspirillum album TaxID=3080276 RepID=A0ABU6JGJ8_9BURK|nr:ion channel [Noviherbaspirillum sp. CPCC 100848]MEC4722777.1 two pore domain potassium channel family protein [Noviherbaspirillum sp. CPCC 100848]
MTLAMTKMFRLPQRHPSAVLLLVQLLGVLLYPFIEETKIGHAGLNALGIVVLGMAIRTVYKTPGPTWVSVALAVPIIVLLGLQTIYEMPGLLPWSSALEAVFYFYAAASLIAYMMEDYQTTVDELFAAAATFTLLVWAFTHLFVMTQALQPGAFSEDGTIRSWSDLNHLSFALLTSTGMGNIVAVSSHARSLASIEMLAGLMYLTAVVTRLIGFTMPTMKTTTKINAETGHAEERHRS